MSAIQSSPVPLSPSPDIKLIDLQSALPAKTPWRFLSSLIGPAEYLLAIDKINAIHRSLPADVPVDEFCRRSLRTLNIEYALTEAELAEIAGSGPLVMVANHPFGGVEGVILAEILLQIRPDVRILGNYLLTRIPALAPYIIPVDPFNPIKSARTNARGLKTALRWVADGGALLAFPAGEVSHLSLRSARIADAPWSPHIAGLILKAKAKALPVYIHGRNSVLFNLLGILHPGLRTMLLPREVINKRTSLIELTMGKYIGWRKLADFSSYQKAAEFLRLSTYLLKHRKELAPRRGGAIGALRRRKTKVGRPIIAPVSKAQLADEIQALAESDCLVNQKEYRVYVTTAQQSPAIMREIGRLREVSFRDVGEGTGLSLDTDVFDQHYQQLILWNHDTREIAGAYRIGRTDAILAQNGPGGLYSTTLFDFKAHFFDHLKNALELGRSFIRTEYQRKFGCLSLLWRGIGEFVSRNPRYRYLFGPVSISQNYHTISRNLMVAFLSHYSMNPKMAHLVRPRRPFKLLRSVERSTPLALLEKDCIEDISMLVSEVEKDSKGVPTLIKHYLKLNGQFLAFNLDKDFADVVDGLIWVDLLKTEPKLLERFMSPSGAAIFYKHHCCATATRAA
jgi:putative hemolysin